MIYEVLDGNTVIDTIVADAEFMTQQFPQGNYRESVAHQTAPATPTPVWEWYIDIGPLFDRFGTAKMAVLTSADPAVQAIIKDLQIRKWVDLELPEVAQSLAYVGTKVPAVTQALQTTILTTPVAPAENLALRKLYFGA